MYAHCMCTDFVSAPDLCTSIQYDFIQVTVSFIRFSISQALIQVLIDHWDVYDLCMYIDSDGYGLDETDSAISWISDDSHLDELIMALRSDLSTLVTFSPDDLQVSI